MNGSPITAAALPLNPRHLGGRALGDSAFKWLTLLMALAVFALIALTGYELANGSLLALRKFGWRFLLSSEWNPVNEQFGALPFIFGTLVSSLIALVIAVPLSIATAIYLTELAPPWLRQMLTLFIELLAAVPSVILGLWGIFVMVPWLRDHLFAWLRGAFGAVILGLGRALGETMAVTMVIGNRPEVSASLFAPGYTLASVVANEFTEATTDVYLNALFEIGLVLLGVTVLVNALARLLLKTLAGPTFNPH